MSGERGGTCATILWPCRRKVAEWETDVRLWQVEFKLEDRDRLGPRLYR